MRDYGIVSPQFWTGATGRELRRGGPQLQVVALYLLTCPSSNMIGLYYLPLALLAHETGSPPEGASEALRRLGEIGFAHYDPEHEVVWVPEMARFQVGEALDRKDNRVLGVIREARPYAKSRFFQAFWDRYRAAYHLPDDPPTSPTGGPPKPLRSPSGRPSEAPPKPGSGSGSGSGAAAPLPPAPTAEARSEAPTERPAAAQPKPPAAEPKPPRPKPAAAEAARVEEPATQPTTAAATTDLAPKTEIDPAEVLDTLVAETGAALDVGDGVSAETLARAVLERVSEPGLSVAQLLGRVRRVGRVLARPAEAFPRWDLVQRSGRISARLLLARGGSALGDAVALAQRRASEQQPSTHRRFPGGEVFLRTDGPKATPEDYRAAMEPLRARLQALSAASGLDG